MRLLHSASVFGLFALSLALAIIGAGNAHAPITVVTVWLLGQPMSVYAVGFDSVNSGYRSGAFKVADRSCETKVGWITARRVVADDVIEQKNARAKSALEWTDKPSPKESMGAFVPAIEPIDPVATDLCGGPVPASSSVIDLYLREKPREFCAVQVRYGEILSGSHDAASDAGLWLEPLRCSTTVAARSLYPGVAS